MAQTPIIQIHKRWFTQYTSEIGRERENVISYSWFTNTHIYIIYKHKHTNIRIQSCNISILHNNETNVRLFVGVLLLFYLNEKKKTAPNVKADIFHDNLKKHAQIGGRIRQRRPRKVCLVNKNSRQTIIALSGRFFFLLVTDNKNK